MDHRAARRPLTDLVLALVVATTGVVGCGTPSSAAHPAPSATHGTDEASGETTDEAAHDPTATAEGAAPTRAAGGGEGAAGDVCERALRCCEAYVALELPADERERATQACAAVRTVAREESVAEEACRSAIDGWRADATQRGLTAPAACGS